MAQQTKLLKQQQTLTQQSLNTQNLLAPYLYKSLGLTPTLDASGKITGFSQDPTIAANQAQEQQITSELLQRQQAALEGNLPVDPGLTTQLDQSTQQLQSEMRANLGPGWETSTPGMTAMNQWSQYKSNILDSARRGDLTMAEQLALGMQGGSQQASGFLMQGGSALAGAPAQYGSMFGQTAQGYNNPLQIMENTRQMQYGAAVANAQNQASAMSGLGGGIGSLAGMLGSAAILSQPGGIGSLFG